MAAVSTLGTVIRQRRQELGLTQEQLAARIGGVRQAEVSRLEADRIAVPRRDRLGRIAAALNLTPGELLVQSGWTNTETTILPSTPDAPPPSLLLTVADESLPSPDHAITRELPPLVVRLRAALEQSWVIHQQSQQLRADLHARYGDCDAWQRSAVVDASADA